MTIFAEFYDLGEDYWEERGIFWKRNKADEVPAFVNGFYLDDPITGNTVSLFDYTTSNNN